MGPCSVPGAGSAGERLVCLSKGISTREGEESESAIVTSDGGDGQQRKKKTRDKQSLYVLLRVRGATRYTVAGQANVIQNRRGPRGEGGGRMECEVTAVKRRKLDVEPAEDRVGESDSVGKIQYVSHAINVHSAESRARIERIRKGRLQDVVCKIDSVRLTRGDFRTLDDGEWLNDEIINAYAFLIRVRSLLSMEAEKGARF